MQETITCPECGHDEFNGPKHEYYALTYYFICDQCRTEIVVRNPFNNE